MVNGPSENIFHTLACQPEIHLSVKMSSMKCKDQIIAYMKEQEEEKISSTLNESLDLETNEAVLRAASALFKCEIVMFYHSEAGTQFNVIKNAKKTLGSLLFILRVFSNEKFSFSSLIFKRENVNSFSNTLKDFQGKVTYGNPGRVHLPTPYYRLAFLSLRANKYHSSSIASHVTDLN